MSGMFANFSQIVLGAGFVSYFFKEAPKWIRVIAVIFIVVSFILAVVFEPEEEDTEEGDK